jgi:hypothetical protein
MSETSPPAGAEISPLTAEAYASLDPRAQATAAEALKKAGYATDKLTVKPAAETKAAPGVTDSAGLARWRYMQDHSTLDPAMIVREAAKAGYDLTVTKAQEDATAGVMAAQAKAASEAKAIAAPEAATGYRIDYGEHGKRDDLAKINSDFTANFLKAGVPATQATALARALLDSQQTYISKLDARYATQDDVDREQAAMKAHMIEEGSRIKSLSTPDLIRLADIGEKALPRAWYDSKSFHTAEAYAQLANLGRVIEQRKGKA